MLHQFFFLICFTHLFFQGTETPVLTLHYLYLSAKCQVSHYLGTVQQYNKLLIVFVTERFRKCSAKIRVGHVLLADFSRKSKFKVEKFGT